jgi:uncharacterized protein YecT (DUF1311 family)
VRWILVTVSAAFLVATPARALGGRLAPPVIHEPFTALTCPIRPDTNIDLQGCEEHRILRTDRAIDAQVKTIFRLLRTQSARVSFVTGEHDWLHFRRASCSAEASHYAGGTAEPVAYLSCSLRKNKAHLADLTIMRKALSQR